MGVATAAESARKDEIFIDLRERFYAAIKAVIGDQGPAYRDVVISVAKDAAPSAEDIRFFLGDYNT